MDKEQLKQKLQQKLNEAAAAMARDHNDSYNVMQQEHAEGYAEALIDCGIITTVEVEAMEKQAEASLTTQ